MPWYIYALLAPALFGVTNFIEKYILDKQVKDPMTVMIISCLINGLLGLFLFFGFRDFRIIEFDKAFFLIISGVLMVIYALPYYKALLLEDASTVIPLFQFIPVFTFLLATFFLKEILTLKQLLGLFIIVLAGLYLGSDRIGKMLKPRRVFWLMLLSCFLISLVLIILKDSSNSYGFWKSMTYNLLGGGFFGLILFCVPTYRKNLIKIDFKKIGSLLLLDDCIDMAGRLCYFYAQTLILVALAELIRSTQLFFVLFYGLFLTLLFPKIIKEDISWKTIKNKLMVGVFMFAGLWLVYF